jgi:uncharacterized protein YqjF (DUF2071 family)
VTSLQGIEAAMSPQGPPLSGRTLMRQSWLDAVFVHWRVDPEQVARFMPRGVRADVFDDSAWVGLIPFRMVDAGFGVGPSVPVLGRFLEQNVRTYGIDAQGRRGVVFLSLDTPSLPATLGARLVFNVPYQWSRMKFSASRDAVRYDVRRRSRPGRRGPTSTLAVRVGERLPGPGDPLSLETFLTARFGLHTTYAGRSWWIPNTHDPWPLHRATVLELSDELVATAGVAMVGETTPDSVLYSPGVCTRFGFPRPFPRVRLAH